MIDYDEPVNILIVVNDDKTEVSLMVKAETPISENEFLAAIEEFYNECHDDLDFNNVIEDLKETDPSLN